MVRVEFKAPWSRSLRLVSAFSVALLAAMELFGCFGGTRLAAVGRVVMVILPVAILLSALPFMVRGYVLTEDEIRIRRLGWDTRLALSTLKSVEGKADAMRGSVRLFGNGGMFSFTGWFWNRQLGRYRAFATDPSRAVVLRYPQRTIVITPHDPQQFILRARTLMHVAGFPR